MPAHAVPSEPPRESFRYELRGGAVAVFAEERGFLDDVLASLESRWRPADIVEHGLVQSLALIELKLVRLDTIEMQALSAAIAEPDGKRLPALNTLVRYRARLTKERWEAEHRLRTAIAQRCTNEAEPRPPGTRRPAAEKAMHRLAETAQEAARLPLNREQRRRLAAVQRKAA